MQCVVISEEEVENTLKNTDVRFMRLWDVYGGLLTETQKEITNLYFECDLSLGEIAEQKGVSRQSVSDCLHKCRKKMEEADAKLHFIAALDEVSQTYSAYMTKVKRWASEQKKTHPEWENELKTLEEIKGSDDEEVIVIKNKVTEK
ncbi:MAG: hypothetical protein MJ091_06485 [Clostridia bacterium]|nr:hypothetical protein [Clostridia bacterium]